MTVPELSRSRSASESSNKPRLRTAMRNLITSSFARVLLIFLLGFAARIAWESYGDAARKTIAGWSPQLAGSHQQLCPLAVLPTD